MANHYPIQEIDSVSYYFITDQAVGYKVYFPDYTGMFGDEIAVSNIYSFVLEAEINGSPIKTKKDDKIGATIDYILSLFFENNLNVVLYVCESSDDKQALRNRKFQEWYNRYNMNGTILKYDNEVNSSGIKYFGSLLVHKDNPESEILKTLFIKTIEDK